MTVIVLAYDANLPAAGPYDFMTGQFNDIRSLWPRNLNHPLSLHDRAFVVASKALTWRKVDFGYILPLHC